MGVESDADRALFLNPEEFGETVTYQGASLIGIFDSTYIETELGAGVPIEGARLRFLCRTIDLTGGGAHGDTLVSTSVDHAGTYKVREVHPDGTGMTELTLEKQ